MEIYRTPDDAEGPFSEWLKNAKPVRREDLPDGWEHWFDLPSQEELEIYRRITKYGITVEISWN